MNVWFDVHDRLQVYARTWAQADSCRCRAGLAGSREAGVRVSARPDPRQRRSVLPTPAESNQVSQRITSHVALWDRSETAEEPPGCK